MNRFKQNSLLGIFACVYLSLSTPVWSHSFSGSADATNNPAPESVEPTEEKGECDGDSGQAADPVDLFTGAQRFKWTDMVVPGPFPIEVSRHYDSHSDYDSVLGYGWALNHDKRLYEYPDGSVIVRFGCGLKQRFVKGQDEGNLYEPVDSTKLRGSLTQNADGAFTVTSLSGWQDTFDTFGRFIKRQRPDGLYHIFTYSNQKADVVGISPYAVNPSLPMATSRHYQLQSVAAYFADGTATGQAVTFTYQASTGRLKTAADQAGRTINYSHDVVNETSTAGNLIGVVGLAGRVSQYKYEDSNDRHNVTFISHSQGMASAINTFDENDKVIAQVWGAKQYTFAYDEVTLTTKVTRTLDEDIRFTDSYTFDETGRVIARVYADGSEAQYTFNAQRRVTSKLTIPGVIYATSSGTSIVTTDSPEIESQPEETYDYDDAGRRTYYQVRSTDAITVTSTWAYDNPLGQLTAYTRESSERPEEKIAVTLSYDASYPGRLVRQARWVSEDTWRTTHYEYNAKGLMSAIVLPNGDRLQYTYTSSGQVASYQLYRDETAIAETLVSYTYDALGFPSSERHPISGMTTYQTDALGRPIKITNALNESDLYSYENDRLSQVERGQSRMHDDTIVAGIRLQLGYDAYLRPNSLSVLVATGEAQILSTRTYDALDRIVNVSDGAGRTITLAYNALGQLHSQTDSAGNTTTMTYDTLGNLISQTDALERTTTMVYDRLGRLIESTDAESAKMRLNYNALGLLTKVTDAKGSVTTYTYNGLGELLQETYPTGESLHYAYNDLGQLIQKISARGLVQKYSYTPFGALSNKSLFASSTATTASSSQSWTYNQRGLLQSVTDSKMGTLYTYAYDALGRTTTTTMAYLPFNYVQSQSYHAFGGVNTLTRAVIANSDTFTYDYDVRGILNAMRLYNQEIGMAVNTGMELTKLSYNDSVYQTRRYNSLGLLEKQTFTKGSAAIETQALGYNSVYNLASLSSSLGGTRAYTYNQVDRLSAVTASGAAISSESFTYDAVGNKTGEGYSYDAMHRITAAPSLTYSYDSDGNLSRRSDGLTLSYDALNRLSTANFGSNNTSYQYDTANRRLSKTVGNVTTYFVWDGNQLIGEYAASGEAIREYAYAPGGVTPLVMKTGNNAYLIHSNYLEAPSFITDTEGNMLWSMQMSAYGQAIINADVDGDGHALELPLRFPGQYADAETGLYYNVNRYYDPVEGRYITRDPLGLYDGTNTYTYVDNNPVNFVDPKGLAACYILFPDYPIAYAEGRTSTWLGGHAGVLGYDDQGRTRYYEYGRYSPTRKGVIGKKLSGDDGNVRRVKIPDLELDENGEPTESSWNNLINALSKQAGKGTKVEATCDAEADESKVYKHVQTIAKNAKREKYNWKPWASNHCRTFARGAVRAGQ